MICPECGASVKEKSRSCPECGKKISRKKSRQSVPDDNASPVTSVATNKRDFISLFATPKIQKKAKLSRIVTLACLLLMLVSYLVVMVTSIEKIPFVSLSLSITDSSDGFEESMASIAEQAEDMEENFEENEDDLKEEFSRKEVKNLRRFIKITKKCAKTFSIYNVGRFINHFEKLVDSDMADRMDIREDTLEGLEDVNQIIHGLSIFLLIGALLCAALVVIGGLFRKTVLICIGMALSVIYCLLFCGFVLLLLNLAAHVMLVLLTLGVNKAYKVYQSSVSAA